MLGYRFLEVQRDRKEVERVPLSIDAWRIEEKQGQILHHSYLQMKGEISVNMGDNRSVARGDESFLKVIFLFLWTRPIVRKGTCVCVVGGLTLPKI